MFDSLRNRLLLALGIALVVTLAVIAVISSAATPSKDVPDAAAIWKKRTRVDLHELPKKYPPRTDSEEAKALDALVAPLDLHLGGRFEGRRRHDDPDEVKSSAIDALRDDLRAAIRGTAPEAAALSAPATGFIEKNAAALDAVAEYVLRHDNIRWREDFAPRGRSSQLYTAEHLYMHRFLIGRGILALDRGDIATAARMLAASQKLSRLLEERQELDAHFIAVGAERLQLALIRRGGGTLNVMPKQPMEGIRERYRSAMSAEAALILASAKGRPVGEQDEVAEVLVRALAGSRFIQAANERVEHEASGVQEILSYPDACMALAKERRAPDGMFSGNFYIFNATQAWRHFVVLALDRAISTAALTGRTDSPCPSVTLKVTEEASTRTVIATGLPAENEGMVGVPAKLTVELKR